MKSFSAGPRTRRCITPGRMGHLIPSADCAIHATMHDGKIRRVEDEVFWRKDGSSFPVEYTTAPMRNDQNEITGAVVAFRDITDRMEAENRIRRLNRVYAVLSGINTLIVRVRDREALFSEACRIAVEAGAFKMAWIGVIDPQTLDGKIVAWHGGEEGYVDKIRLTARDGTPDSERPACRALRQSQPVICNDIATDPSMGELRDELLERGHRSRRMFSADGGGTAGGGYRAVCRRTQCLRRGGNAAAVGIGRQHLVRDRSHRERRERSTTSPTTMSSPGSRTAACFSSGWRSTCAAPSAAAQACRGPDRSGAVQEHQRQPRPAGRRRAAEAGGGLADAQHRGRQPVGARRTRIILPWCFRK